MAAERRDLQRLQPIIKCVEGLAFENSVYQTISKPAILFYSGGFGSRPESIVLTVVNVSSCLLRKV